MFLYTGSSNCIAINNQIKNYWNGNGRLHESQISFYCFTFSSGFFERKIDSGLSRIKLLVVRTNQRFPIFIDITILYGNIMDIALDLAEL